MKKYLKDEWEIEENYEIVQYLLYIINAVMMVAGATVFAFAIHMTYHENFQNTLRALNTDFYYNGVAVLLAASSLVVLTTFLGGCAAFHSSRKAIVVYLVLTGVTFILLLGGSIYLLNNGLESTNLYPHIQNSMRNFIYQYQNDMAAKTVVDQTQEIIGCCGGYGANDYIDVHQPIPDTCRNQVTGNQYRYSCAEVLSWTIERNTGWLCGISLGICFLQIFAVILSLYACKYITSLKNKT